MSHLNTGKERSLTIQVFKTVNGATVPGYENKIYDGRLAFDYEDWISFEAITDVQLSRLTQDEY